MGAIQAREIRDTLELDQLLHWHLQYNHYPPIHTIFIESAKKAINLANHNEWETNINLPNGRKLSVAEIVDRLHLDTFLDSEE